VAHGGGSRPHIQHREDECFYVLEGRFEFVVEGAKVEAGPGSLVYVPKGNLHAFENTGNTTGRVLVSQTPGGITKAS
jgi:mannose-6-phosphate isomerase-like protein (cupin superfamily)